MHAITAIGLMISCAVAGADPLTFRTRHVADVEGAETVAYLHPLVLRVTAGSSLRTIDVIPGGGRPSINTDYTLELGGTIRESSSWLPASVTISPEDAGLPREVLDTPFFRGLDDAEWVCTHISDGMVKRNGFWWSGHMNALAIQVTVPGDPPIRRGAVVASLPVDGTYEQGRLPRHIFRALAQDHGLPDCVKVLPDNRRAIGVDEHEPGTGSDLPGSVTLFARPHVPNGATRTVVFPNELALREGVRIHPSLVDTPATDIEPEYLAIAGDTAYVTLQENNAIGVFDLEAGSWTDVIAIPVVSQSIDPSDKDGGIHIRAEVACMPMPDQIVHAGGALFFPGEGDTRAEIGEEGVVDHARLGDLVETGKALPHPGLERLKVCTFTGDTDGDGVIDVPHAFGSRALHKYDLWTRAWSDTGDLIERTIAERFPDHFDDTRSDDRGPEPEGITLGEVDGRTVLFVSIERPGAVMAFDTSLNFLGMVMSAAEGHTGPEGMCFVPKENSPLGVDTLAVAFEHSGHVVLYEVVLDLE